MKKSISKIVLSMLVLVVSMGFGPKAQAASIFSDTNRHWAETDIYKGVTEGFIKGYTDGTFKPDQPVTRAEFSKMLNQALGVTGTVNITMKDLKTTDWYYNEVRKAVAAGYITGYTDNTFKPDNNITRQEAASMIAKVIPNYGTTTKLTGILDTKDISNWAKDSVEAVFGRGYITGDNRKMYRPLGALTRGEACVILLRLLDGEQIVTTSNYVIDKKGTTRSRTIYTNNLTIHKDVGTGDVDLDRVVVLGTLSVQGGGDSTIEIEDSRIRNMNVEKTSGDVRVLLRGNTTVETTTAKYGSTLEQVSMSGEGYKNLRLDGSNLSKQETILKGTFPSVIVDDTVLLSLTSGKITDLRVNSGANGSVISLASGTTVTNTDVYSRTSFTGTGRITTLKAYANDITYQTKPSKITSGTSLSRPPVLGEDTEGPVPTFTPKSDATGVATNTKIVVTFNEAIYLDRGGRVYADDIKDIIEIRKDKSTGTRISFTGTISSDRKTLTITPDEILDMSTYYYIILLDESIEDAEGNENEKETSRFRTGNQDLVPPKPTFSPVNNATNIAVTSNITISFDEAIRLVNNSAVTNSNITSFIELRENSATGTKKAFSASINSSKRLITIDPSADLAIDKNYYIIILANRIEDASDNAVPKTTSTFKTGLPIAVTPTITTNPATTTAIANNGTVSVTLSSTTSGGNIYYTTNGSTPTVTPALLYTEPFYVDNVGNLVDGQTITVKAIYTKVGMTNSAVATKAITFVTNRVATPTITTDPSNVSAIPSDKPVVVTIESATDGSKIFYAIENEDNYNEYDGSITIKDIDPDGDVITIYAYATKIGMGMSEVSTKDINFINNTVKTPTIEIVKASDNESASVTIVSETSSAKIYVTINDGPEIELSGNSFDVTVLEYGTSVTIKATARKSGMLDSEMSTKTVSF
ncbi:S-layer homology domain-containing protein [Petrocella sp. FN5]|uniref:S-layer homology domain-containing protein n=1 Tax=Petrocella sp. FN5 TaxID=3032002 RepID=UPI0023DA8540|nr:S-layer homology domain-containing protein [Petrocella sp. FN5]MDF1617943.1 S-layer homology domain-containing protein [Petrocella sp. FN5]